MTIWVALAGGAGAVIVALITWFTSKRLASGRVSTTEATTLWAAAEQIRMELRDEVARLRVRLDSADTALRAAQEELRLARAEIGRLERRINGKPKAPDT